MNNQSRLTFREAEPGTAYITVPCANREYQRTVRIEDIMEHYKGPMLNMDFNTAGELLGVEIVLYEGDEDATGDETM